MRGVLSVMKLEKITLFVEDLECPWARERNRSANGWGDQEVVMHQYGGRMPVNICGVGAGTPDYDRGVQVCADTASSAPRFGGGEISTDGIKRAVSPFEEGFAGGGGTVKQSRSRRD